MSRPTSEDLTDYVAGYISKTVGGDVHAIPFQSLEEAGMDSLELIELVLVIEDKFGIAIDDCLLLGNYTVASLCGMIADSNGGCR